jgi:hypothetical protein
MMALFVAGVSSDQPFHAQFNGETSTSSMECATTISRSHFRLALLWRRCDGAFIMGDKSPKATNKHAAQKQAKTNAGTQRKNTEAAAKQVVKAKK